MLCCVFVCLFICLFICLIIYELLYCVIIRPGRQDYGPRPLVWVYTPAEASASQPSPSTLLSILHDLRPLAIPISEHTKSESDMPNQDGFSVSSQEKPTPLPKGKNRSLIVPSCSSHPPFPSSPQLDYIQMSQVDGLQVIQQQLKSLTIQWSLHSLEELLVEGVEERRRGLTLPGGGTGAVGESPRSPSLTIAENNWRLTSTAKLTNSR